MKNIQKIIRFFIDHSEESFSINFIAKKLKLNYRIAYESIKELENQEIVSIKKSGNTNQCSYAYKLNEDILFAENQKKQELIENKNLKVFYNHLNDIKNPFFICLVFGSYAKGTQTKESDIDICIISDNDEIKQKIAKIVKILPLNMHLLDFTITEFISMLKTTDQNVGKKIIRDRIILKGIENFYELIKYAR